MKEYSIIILTFNSIKFISQCLDSIFAQSCQNLEVFIVDNGSNDGTVDLIRQQYPQVILIENKENLGAAKARNQGIDISKGKWVLALDCDVILEKDFLKEIMEFVRTADNSVGMFQPKILNNGKKTIFSCGIYLSRIKRFYDIGNGKIDGKKFNIPKYIFGACSAATLYNRKMLEDIKEDTGYFDERFFFLMEDVDISFRAQENKWKVLYCPDAICYHFGNSSYTPHKRRQYLCWRNRELFLSKYRFNSFELSIYYLIYGLPRVIFLLLTNSFVRRDLLEGKTLE